MCTLINVAVGVDFAYELKFRKGQADEAACSSLAASVGLTVISQIVFLFCTWYGLSRWSKGDDEAAFEVGYGRAASKSAVGASNSPAYRRCTVWAEVVVTRSVRRVSALRGRAGLPLYRGPWSDLALPQAQLYRPAI